MASSSRQLLPLLLLSLLFLVVSALEVTWGDAKALWNLSAVTTALHPVITDVWTLEGCHRTIKDSTDTYLQVLRTWWTDTRTLVVPLNSVLQDNTRLHATDREGRMLRASLSAWFGIHFDAQTNQVVTKDLDKLFLIRDTFNKLQAMLDNQLTFPYKVQKPDRYIFCGSDWHSLTDYVHHRSTGKIEYEVDSSGKKRYLNIHDSNDYPLATTDGEINDLQVPKGRDWKLYAYWIPLWKSYFYHAQKYPVSKDTGDRHVCNSGRILGLTYEYAPKGPETRFPQSNKKRLTVTFCPSAFQTTKEFSCHSIHQTNGPVTPLAKISDRQPTVLTFLHEAVHAVMGSEITPDEVEVGGAWKMAYGALNVLKYANPPSNSQMKPAEDMTTAPEPYAFAAFAYWLSVNPVKEGDYWDWTAGSARHRSDTP